MPATSATPMSTLSPSTLTPSTPVAHAEGRASGWNPAAERLFADVGLLFSTEPDLESRLGDLARTVVSGLADCCLVHLVSAHGAVEKTEVAAADVQVETRLREMLGAFPYLPRRNKSLVARVLNRGEAVLLQDDEGSTLETLLQDEQDLAILGHAGARSVVAVPLRARDHIVGTVTLVRGRQHPPYQAADVAVAVEVARRAALAIDQARRYQAAQMAIRQRDEVLSVVAHDVGNALTSVSLAATLLLEHASDGMAGPKTQVFLTLIQNRVAVMARLLEDLLDVSRIEAGRLSLRRECQPAGEQVMRAVEALQPLAEARSIRLSVVPTDSLPLVYADGKRLLQVLENIIGNAVKFTPPQGQITIRIGRAGDAVQYSVADTGPGIAAGHLPHVFDWFWQAAHEHKMGTGLGLAIAQRIVELHGGHISVESKPGEGSTFFFTMPVAKQNAARARVSRFVTP